MGGEGADGAGLVDHDPAGGQRPAQAFDRTIEPQHGSDRVAEHRCRAPLRLASFWGHVTHLEGRLILGASSAEKATAVDIGQWISAALILILTISLVLAVRWALARRDPARLASDPGVRTRVRLLQRLAMTLIVLIGLAAAASQLGVLDGIANTVLATSAITAIIVGFAARATLANSLAGLVLTITQPVRVGDQVKIGDHEGVVADVTLTATTLRTVLGTTIRVPNEQVARA